MKHERGVGSVRGEPGSIDPEIAAADDSDLRLLQDPVYEERVRHWLGDPKKLLDWRHAMARTQALADMWGTGSAAAGWVAWCRRRYSR